MHGRYQTPPTGTLLSQSQNPFILRLCWQAATLALWNLCAPVPSTAWGCWPAPSWMTCGQWWARPSTWSLLSAAPPRTHWHQLLWKSPWSTSMYQIQKNGELEHLLSSSQTIWRFPGLLLRKLKTSSLTSVHPRSILWRAFFPLDYQVFSPLPPSPSN